MVRGRGAAGCCSRAAGSSGALEGREDAKRKFGATNIRLSAATTSLPVVRGFVLLQLHAGCGLAASKLRERLLALSKVARLGYREGVF